MPTEYVDAHIGGLNSSTVTRIDKFNVTVNRMQFLTEKTWSCDACKTLNRFVKVFLLRHHIGDHLALFALQDAVLIDALQRVPKSNLVRTIGVFVACIEPSYVHPF